jgi:hypothetical protein
MVGVVLVVDVDVDVDMGYGGGGGGGGGFVREGLRMARGGVACRLSTVVHCECKGASS